MEFAPYEDLRKRLEYDLIAKINRIELPNNQESCGVLVHFLSGALTAFTLELLWKECSDRFTISDFRLIRISPKINHVENCILYDIDFRIFDGSAVAIDLSIQYRLTEDRIRLAKSSSKAIPDTRDTSRWGKLAGDI